MASIKMMSASPEGVTPETDADMKAIMAVVETPVVMKNIAVMAVMADADVTEILVKTVPDTECTRRKVISIQPLDASR